MSESAHTQKLVWMKTVHLTAAATVHCVPENVHFFNSELSKMNRFFGMLNPEIILHITLTDLSTSPVKCSHCKFSCQIFSGFNVLIIIQIGSFLRVIQKIKGKRFWDTV